MPPTVTVRAPATTANMGPGFDCLAMALDIWNTVKVDLNADGVVVNGEGKEELPTDEANLVHRSFAIPFEKAGRPVPRARIVCDNRIPLARGLGSSAAAAVAGLVAGNELSGRPLDSAQILDLAAALEGHPDNVSAAVFGGCQIVVQDEGRLTTSGSPSFGVCGRSCSYRTTACRRTRRGPCWTAAWTGGTPCTTWAASRCSSPRWRPATPRI